MNEILREFAINGSKDPNVWFSIEPFLSQTNPDIEKLKEIVSGGQRIMLHINMDQDLEKDIDIKNYKKYFVRGDSIDAKQKIANFVYCLNNYDGRIYKCMRELLELDETKVGKRESNKNIINMIYYVIDEYINGKPFNSDLLRLIKLCKKLSKKFGDDVWIANCIFFVNQFTL